MRSLADITTWYREVQWGFATTSEGKEFFVHKIAFRDHRQVSSVCTGTRIEFDLPIVQTAKQVFLDKLNAGKYRDDPTVNHRNPRRTTVANKKPRATNVWVVRR